MEQTRMIGASSYTGQSKVLDQARKRAIERLVARRLLGRVLQLPPGEDGRLRSAMDVRLVADLPVVVARPVVPGEGGPRGPKRKMDDPARVAQLILTAQGLLGSAPCRSHMSTTVSTMSIIVDNAGSHG